MYLPMCALSMQVEENTTGITYPPELAAAADKAAAHTAQAASCSQQAYTQSSDEIVIDSSEPEDNGQELDLAASVQPPPAECHASACQQQQVSCLPWFLSCYNAVHVM